MNPLSPSRLGALVLSLVVLTAGSTRILADDRFAVTVGKKGDLIIFSEKGDQVADLPAPSISQAVTVNGTTTFDVSYGRDVNDRLTAIIAPNATQPADLHFTCLGKSVDSDKSAVVTLTFSRGLGSVSVDPGYVGVVEVNSNKVHHRELADDTASEAPAPMMPSEPYNPAPAPRTETQMSPPPMASDTMPSTPSSSPAASDAYINPAGYAPLTNEPLFWSEPVTDPSGNAPHVGLSQMKLVDLQGSVSVRTPGGSVMDGTDGMVVSSGSTVSTGEASSVAIFIGGIDSARLMPNTEVSISHSYNGSFRHTDLHLVQGSIFSRIGHRAGETQRYAVITPQGTSVAHGTITLDAVVNNIHYAIVLTGTYGLFDPSGRHVGDVSGNGGHDIGIGSMPPSPGGHEVLLQNLLLARESNTNTNLVYLHIQAGIATHDEYLYYTAAIYDALEQDGFTPGRNTFRLASQLAVGVTVAFHDLYAPFYTRPMSYFR